MDFEIHGHRHGDFLFSQLEEYRPCWLEICAALNEISDEDIIAEFEREQRKAKSISQAINRLVKVGLTKRGWHAESPIFADKAYNFDPSGRSRGTWRLDFAKGPLSVEVAFNHRSDIAWNLLKPTLASQLNHVPKAIQTDGGVIICATEEMKEAGGFDNAVGTFDDYVAYLEPLAQVLTAPMVVIGLQAPQTFKVVTATHTDPVTGSSKKIGSIERLR